MDIELMHTNVEAASSLLKSLANPNRLLVLCALVTREHTAGELEQLTGLSQSAISQHLARLREEQLVATRRQAQRIYYSLCSSDAAAVLATLHGIYCADE
ncbi:MAG: winged helix-turn-helix transcriptional regulator [Halioglobus sp.]|nr:winged helix-turn-helix transcriptional regulator [Halioglobus sp.]